MKIGLSNIFSFRPHVEHLVYISKLLEKAGHEVFFLTCDASVTNCYSRSIKGKSKLSECPKCILGGVRSYPVNNVTSIKSIPAVELPVNRLDDMALSSSCTLHRTESEEEWLHDDVVKTRKTLYSSINSTYQSTLSWVKENDLQAVICFNGRMDLTRGVIEACKDSGIPFLSHERSWFGDGIQLFPNSNCMSIADIDRLTQEYSNKALTSRQASIAAKLISERFLQKNILEWRLYNKKPTKVVWPTKAEGEKVLVLPSSKNEFAGHAEWKSSWLDKTQALDDYFEVFKISPAQVVVRGHPNWSENIGKVFGERSLYRYREWCKSRGIHFIESSDKASTYDLIQHSDIVIMNGGSSAVEAGVCGKKVVCLGPSPYNNSGFVSGYFNKKEMLDDQSRVGSLSAEDIIRKTLRYVYVRYGRFPQFVTHVKAVKTTEYKYFEGADANKIINMIHAGEVIADDSDFSESSESEDRVVNCLKNKDWETLSSFDFYDREGVPLDVNRKYFLRWLDVLRDKLPRGDR